MAKSVTRVLSKVHLKDHELDKAFDGTFNTVRIGTRHHDFERYRASATYYENRGWTTRKGDRRAQGSLLTDSQAKDFLEKCIDELYTNGTRKGDLFVECLLRKKVPLLPAEEALSKLSEKTSRR